MRTNISEHQDINWVKSQLLISEAGEQTVVLTTGVHTDKHFSGMIVHTPNSIRVGEYYEDFQKYIFKPYSGMITLMND